MILTRLENISLEMHIIIVVSSLAFQATEDHLMNHVNICFNYAYMEVVARISSPYTTS
jgi:hypothetical protein